MAKPLQKWTVYPHGPIEKLAENLWRVEARLPGSAPVFRVLTVVRMNDGRLIVHNGIALDEPQMKELEAFGTPAFLIVPNGAHRLDAKIYKDRYPAIQVVCPPAARSKVEQVVKVDSTAGFGDDSVRYEILDGTAGREGYLEVRSQDGVSLVLNDMVLNNRHGKGFTGFMFKLLGFSGPAPRVAPLVRMILVKDRPAARAHLERLAATPRLKRVVVSHGALFGGEELRAAAVAGL